MTPKQEAFARAYVETGNASEAYRRAYNAQKMKREVIAVKACELLDSGNVAVMVEQLRSELAKRHEVTLDSLLDELEESRVWAIAFEQAPAAIAATMGKAKLLGLIVDKVDQRILTASLPVTVDELI